LDVLRRTYGSVVVRRHAIAKETVAKTGAIEFQTEVRSLQVRRILFRLQHWILLNLVAPIVVGIDVVLDLVIGGRAEFGK
jgi:hypothetical protein